MRLRFSTASFLAALVSAVGACTEQGAGSIEGVGTLEVIEVDIATTVPARVLAVLVQEGDPVRAGDTIAVLSLPTMDADLALARAAEAQARAVLDEFETGARRGELDRGVAELAAREAELARLVDDSTRLAPLVASALAAESDLVAARARVLAAAAARDAAAAELGLLREGTRRERITSGRAEVARAQAGVAAVEATAGDLVLRAPADGVVMARHAEPGEVLPAARPVATLARIDRPWVRVFLGPQYLPLVRIGDSATARLDAFPDLPFPGRVTAVATRAEYTPRVALTERERADLLYGIRVDFTDTTGMLKAGLPVTVRFLPREPPR